MFRIFLGSVRAIRIFIDRLLYARAFHLMDALLRALLPYEGLMQLGFNHSLRVNGEDVCISITEEKNSRAMESQTQKRH